jgi:hypothetical protein
VNAVAHCKHVQVIRCDIKPESVASTKDVKNGMISEKKPRGIPLGIIFQTPLYFLEN